MLTRKEIDYMLKHYPPYPGRDYAKMTLEKLQKNIELFERCYRGKEHEILFSDGVPLKFEIEDRYIAHMAGLDSKKLRKTDLDIPGGTYQLVKKIISDHNETIRINEDAISNNETLLNYYKIKVRSDIFQKFSNIYELNFGCIRYDKDSVENGNTKSLKSSNFLFMESDELNAQYYMMGIATDEEKNVNYIETLFPDTYPESMFNNQTVVIPTHMTVSNDEDYYRYFEANDRSKLELLKKYREQLREYKVNYDVMADYEATLSKGASEKAKQKIL